MPSIENPRTAGLAAFAFQNFRLFQVARFGMVLALEMQSVAVGWQIYEITHRALDLGYVGLAQFLPGILLFLVSGHVVDRFDRRVILVLCYCGYVLCSTLLLVVALRGVKSVGLIYCILVLIGVVRSFNGPVSRAILPQLVPQHHFPSAVAWTSSVYQAATILGPAAGGGPLGEVERGGPG
jgi:MFS family permease